MALSEIIMLGDPVLQQVCEEVKKDEIKWLSPEIIKMWRLITEFREKYGRGRAMAAPQIGLTKKIIAFNIDKPFVMINPVIVTASKEMVSIWDDCMSFPGLLVNLQRHKRIKVSYFDMDMTKHIENYENDMSELIQHEYDHLNGILAIDRAAANSKSFRWIVMPEKTGRITDKDLV